MSTVDEIVLIGISRRYTKRQLYRTKNLIKAAIRSYIGFETRSELMDEKTRKGVVTLSGEYFKLLDKHADGEPLPFIPNCDLQTLYDKIVCPFFDVYKWYQHNLTDTDKLLSDLAKSLPVAPFIETVPGCGYKGLALIVAETGDLSNYSNPAKVWKRMGVGLVQHNGENIRQRRAVDAELAIKMGYKPERRAVLYTISESMVKNKDRNPSQYGQRYTDEKAKQIALNPEIRPIQAHLRAKRKMEKLFLKNLWIAWNNK